MLKMTIFFLLFSSSLWSMDLSIAYLKGKDQTLASEVSALQKYKVLIIPGVLAQSFISDSNNQIKLTFLFEDGFKEQIKLLETLKIEYEFLNLETENSPGKNALAITNVIEKSILPVLIYSHSKGGLDVLEAIRQNPGLLVKIHGWASIQSPFWGAPVASGFNNNLVLRDSSNNLFEWMGGDASGMSSLTIEERNTYMDTNEIKNLLIVINQKIKFLNFASYKTNTLGIDTPLELFRNYTDLSDGANDGVVPLKSALMKEHGVDINFIIEEEVDHLMTMTRYRLDNNQYSQKTHTISVLKLLL
ncbi:MAG: hypothetical protein H7281_08895 [Bacteriovorax sp.]|nr:hypothetical protein [Bacteriovorax sp.]